MQWKTEAVKQLAVKQYKLGILLTLRLNSCGYLLMKRRSNLFLLQNQAGFKKNKQITARLC